MIEGVDYINATIYIKPNGRKRQIQITNVYPDDMKYIYDNKLTLSMESMDDDTHIVYLANPHNDEELTEISFNRSCQEVVSTLIERYKKTLK